MPKPITSVLFQFSWTWSAERVAQLKAPEMTLIVSKTARSDDHDFEALLFHRR